MKHLGDITKISGHTAPIVDCIIGGSPCQDLSVAGKRAGLDGERSGLFMEQIRIIKEMRDNDRRNGRSDVDVRPRYMVWENVPGAFSSNKGEDFRVVLEEVARISEEGVSIPRPEKGKWNTSGVIIGDGYSIAWRVFDAQYWGVPQRRRRICLIADFNGHSATEILFNEAKHKGSSYRRDSDSSVGYLGDKSRSEVQPISEGLSGNTQPSQETREDTPTDASGSIGASYQRPSLSFQERGEKPGGGKGILIQEDHLVQKIYATVYKGDGAVGGETTFAIVGDHENRPSDMTNLVVEIDRASYNQGKNAQFNIGISENGIAHTVIAKGPGAVVYTTSHGGFHMNPSKNIANTLEASDYKDAPTVVAVDLTNLTETEVNGALQASATHNIHSNNVVRIKYIVRRLTPLECERLQGFPDGWTDIGEYINTQGKKCKTSDAARYKALGNSIALPSWKWVLKRLCENYERDATLASLFDGIGGFPLIWEQINGKGSCLWASEIEEFPIAVTKMRIG